MAEGQSTTVPSVEYRDIEGFPGYRVGDDGSVWSCWSQGGPRRVVGAIYRQLKLSTDTGGYRQVCLGSQPQRHLLVHRLVLLAFAGECPDGMVCCHRDGDRSNNALANLRWDTRLANVADTVVHGTKAEGERHGNSRLTADTIRAIRRDHETGLSYGQVAKKYGTSRINVSRIVRRLAWRCVS